MKLKKILAAVAALATVATAFSSVAFAESAYGSPKLTYSFEYPADPDGDGSEYLGVTISYEGFENLARANNTATSGAAITNVMLKLNYDDTKLSYEFGDNAGSFSGSVGGTDPSYAVGLALNRNTPYATSGDLFVAYFSVAAGVDFSKEAVEFSYVTDPADDACLAMTVSAGTSSGIEKTVYGESSISTETLIYDETFSYGTKAPATTTYTVTADGNVEVTGADISAPVAEGTVINVAAKAKTGYTAKLLANGVEVAEGDYTVTGNVDFTVAYTSIYKYTLDDKGTCQKTEGGKVSKGIYYSISIKNVDTAMTLGVEGKAFTASGIAEITGDPNVSMTYVILGVPDALYDNVPDAITISGVANGTYEAE